MIGERGGGAGDPPPPLLDDVDFVVGFLGGGGGGGRGRVSVSISAGVVVVSNVSVASYLRCGNVSVNPSPGPNSRLV